MKWRWLAVLAPLLLGLSFFSPTVRWCAIGWAGGETFYCGRPTSYWQSEVKHEIKSRKLVKVMITCGMSDRDLPAPPPPPTLFDQVRDSLARALSAQATLPLLDNPAALPILIELLADSDPEVREYGVWTIRGFGPAAQEAVPSLERLLTDQSPEVRRAAIVALVGIKERPEISFPMLRDRDPLVRQRVANLLRDAGPVAIPALREALNDPDKEVRVEAAAALRQIEYPSDRP